MLRAEVDLDVIDVVSIALPPTVARTTRRAASAERVESPMGKGYAAAAGGWSFRVRTNADEDMNDEAALALSVAPRTRHVAVHDACLGNAAVLGRGRGKLCRRGEARLRVASRQGHAGVRSKPRRRRSAARPVR